MELKLTERNETRMNNKQRDHYWAKGLVPAAVHGRSIEPGVCFVHTKHAHHWHRGSMFDVTWNGQPFKASIDELQYTPVGNRLLHVTFQLVGKNEKTHIDVPLRTVGSAPGEKEGGMVHLQFESISIEGKPDALPEYFEIDVSALQIGDKITLADLKAPAGCTWYQEDESKALVTCAHIKTKAVEEEAAPEETSAEATPEVESDQEAA
ncbi:MAG: 50S ribosomal protein L25 [Halobacteriovoraceae bacterium]|nr:50S ribosomal protein L25 [Halobacteriovoraceae bacterium]|tara:strand:- start:82978 stop:83601 length:624 start_codon:yes stop_codon:yes gene_type:complete